MLNTLCCNMRPLIAYYIRAMDEDRKKASKGLVETSDSICTLDSRSHWLKPMMGCPSPLLTPLITQVWL